MKGTPSVKYSLVFPAPPVLNIRYVSAQPWRVAGMLSPPSQHPFSWRGVPMATRRCHLCAMNGTARAGGTRGHTGLLRTHCVPGHGRGMKAAGNGNFFIH